VAIARRPLLRLAASKEPDHPGILDQLNQLGHKTGVVVATVAPTTSSAAVNVVPLSITVDGTYFQIRNLLNKLRKQVQVGKNGRIVANGRLYDVQSLNIAMGSAAGQLAATITVKASTFSPRTQTTQTTAAAAQWEALLMAVAGTQPPQEGGIEGCR
jgi:Tfp pilus assembly protein PilO